MLHRCLSTRVLAGALVLAACSRVEEPVSERRSLPPSPAAPSAPPAAQAPAPALLVPTQLLTLPSSAYQAGIFADDEAIELLTSTAAYRLLPGKEPIVRALDLSFAATVTRQSYVYWSGAAIWSDSRRASKPGGAIKLAALAEQPQRFVADIAGNEFAFLSRSQDNRYSIAKVENRRVKTLYTSRGSIDTLTMIGDALYFVERPADAAWRIGRVNVAGGAASFTEAKTGRWPASLSGTKEVVYYDGNRRDVLSLSPDLQQERTLAKDFICSPLAVGASVYCSTMEGIFELPATGKPRQVVAASRNLITRLAVDSTRLVWISDVGGQGQDRLAVNVVSISTLSAEGEGQR
ncbi:MAG TPA: hypothetical protein VJV79_11660 [Polyangiaceae bacterium]|nr:hypothetical protein [Polyangiaceae bacterium]